jgi:predicted XRE-type DNA-binding protein
MNDHLRDRIMSKKHRLGSGNFLKDRGYEDPDETRIKYLLSNEISLTVDDNDMSQSAVAKRTGLKRPDVSRIVNGNVAEYSVWRLIKVLAALGKNVSIGIGPAEHDQGNIFTFNYGEEPNSSPSM